MDDAAFLAFLADVKKRAEGFEREDYVSEDIRRVLRDFLQISASFAALKTDANSVGADARVFKKRFEGAKAELKTAEKRIEQLKTAGFTAIVQVKQISAEISLLPQNDSTNRIRAAFGKVAEQLIEISKI